MGSRDASFLIDVGLRSTHEGCHEIIFQLIVAHHGLLFALVGLGHMFLINERGMIELSKTFWQP